MTHNDTHQEKISETEKKVIRGWITGGNQQVKGAMP
jgi:hypothetical protein